MGYIVDQQQAMFENLENTTADVEKNVREGWVLCICLNYVVLTWCVRDEHTKVAVEHGKPFICCGRFTFCLTPYFYLFLATTSCSPPRTS